MTAKEVLVQILDELPEGHVDRLLDYAMYLTWREERDAWQQFGKRQLARAYGNDEPEYSLLDVRKDALP